MYLGQVTCFVSVYLTVGFTLERYIAINFPLSKTRLCTLSKAKRFIYGVVSIALVLFTYVWQIAEVVELPMLPKLENLTTEVSRGRKQVLICSVPETYFKFSEIANYIDSGVTLIVPVLVITFCNISIVMSVNKTLRQRSGLIPLAPNDGSREDIEKNTCKLQVHLTAMNFLFEYMPSCVF